MFPSRQGEKVARCQSMLALISLSLFMTREQKTKNFSLNQSCVVGLCGVKFFSVLRKEDFDLKFSFCSIRSDEKVLVICCVVLLSQCPIRSSNQFSIRRENPKCQSKWFVQRECQSYISWLLNPTDSVTSKLHPTVDIISFVMPIHTTA